MKIAALAFVTALAIPSMPYAKEGTPINEGGAAAGKKKVESLGKAKPGSKLFDTPSIDAEAPTGLITSDLGGRELQFFQEAFELGSLETWLGGQAKTRGEGDRVKALGEALQDTQAEENQMLVRLARRKGLTLASSKATAQQQKEVQAQLSALEGAKFDTAVLEQIVVATQKEAEAYARAAESSDPEVKRFAEQISGIVKDKLVLATRVSGKPVPPGEKPGFRENHPAIPATVAPIAAGPAGSTPGGAAAATGGKATPAANATPTAAGATTGPKATPTAGPSPTASRTVPTLGATPQSTPARAVTQPASPAASPGGTATTPPATK